MSKIVPLAITVSNGSINTTITVTKINIVPEFLDICDVDAINESFYEHGVAFVEDSNEERLASLGQELGIIVKPRNGIGNGISNIRCSPDLLEQAPGRGYSSEELFFHTDRSGWDVPPRILITTLKTKSETGGQSLFVDTRAVVQKLQLSDPHLYKLITNAKYSCFRADDGSFIPRPIYDEKSGIFRFRFDDGIHIAPSLVDKISQLKNIIFQNAFVVELKPGQCYIADNHRFLHGRTSFTGTRELLRILAHAPPAMPKHFVLFDVDGTLCRAEALSIDAYYGCISHVVGRKITHENTKINLHGVTDLSLLYGILRFHQVPEEELERTAKKFFALHPQYLRDSLERGFVSKPCPQVQEFLNWMTNETDSHGHPISVGLLTGNSKANALLKISAAGLPTEIFDLSISSFGDEHPSRASLVQDAKSKIEARHGLPIRTSQIILIGDTPLDIECAQQTGCKVVAVASGNYTQEKLIALTPDFSCDKLPEAQDYLSGILKDGREVEWN
ncbi:Clavaminate synthase-like protein [Delitschia confertaspora ATCC 74209]|uniref:Clavaminate synthase-like protein n=1 Tax=Delitschia confertaspora ATCC 74209 TaxID=1513339 RepID=A0A9P4MUT9_9PLEO|nr:Clavaminate synthase-like protein [Delitschia confertaspora ATCC 74209]